MTADQEKGETEHAKQTNKKSGERVNAQRRGTHVPPSESSQIKPSRRDILRKAAATSIIGFGGTMAAGVGSAAATDTKSPIESVDKLSGKEREHALSLARKDSRTRQLKDHFTQQGYQPLFGDAKAFKTDTKKYSEWYTVVIPFETDDPEREVFITYTDAPTTDTPVTGQNIQHIVPEDGSESYWKITEYISKKSGIESHQRQLRQAQVAQLSVSNNDQIGTMLINCPNPDWGCILSLAGSYAATIAACGSCAASSGWLVNACLACIATLLNEAGVAIKCGGPDNDPCR